MNTSPTTTLQVRCCYGKGVKDNEKCGNREGRDQCERSANCESLVRAKTPTASTTTKEPGCCYSDTAKTNALCGDLQGRDKCVTIRKGDGHHIGALKTNTPNLDYSCMKQVTHST